MIIPILQYGGGLAILGALLGWGMASALKVEGVRGATWGALSGCVLGFIIGFFAGLGSV